MAGNGKSMGDIFNERRAASRNKNVNVPPQAPPPQQQQQQQQQPRTLAESGRPPSMLEIQQQQETEQAQQSQGQGRQYQNRGNQREAGGAPRGNYREDRRRDDRGGGGGGGSYRDRDGGGDRGGGGGYRGGDRDGYRGDRGGDSSHHSRSSNRRNTSSNTILSYHEQGVVISLRESYGFLKCADRDEELFFHVSEVHSPGGFDGLQMNDEMEFHVGTSDRDADGKLKAFHVTRLPENLCPIQWFLTENGGERCQGTIVRPAPGRMMAITTRDGKRTALNEGSIRLLVTPDDTEDATTTTEKVEEVTLQYTSEDMRSNKESRTSTRLERLDKVEFTMVLERRTKRKYARDVVLVQSERDRLREEREAEMMSRATLERGIICSLKDGSGNSGGNTGGGGGGQGFGFLRSTARRSEIYFHFSHVEGEKDQLKEGRDVEFWVVAEEQGLDDQGSFSRGGGGGGGSSGAGGRNRSNSIKEKLSARKVTFLSAGSVIFQHVLAENVCGTVNKIPQMREGGHYQNSALAVGTVVLETPLVVTPPLPASGGDVSAIQPPITIASVNFYPHDAPGGVISHYNSREFSSQNSSSNPSGSSLWIRKGDILRFNVVQEVVDGTFRLVGATVPAPSADGDATEKQPSTKKKKPVVHLQSLQPAGRTCGIIGSIKDGYGFINCVERNVDCYFRLTEVFPPSLQLDLCSSTVGNTPPRKDAPSLQIGSHIEFDLSVNPSANSNSSNYNNNQSSLRNSKNQNDRDQQLRAQRIAILPKRTIVTTKILVTSVRGVVVKEHQNGSGMIELRDATSENGSSSAANTPVLPMAMDERYVLVAQLLDSMDTGGGVTYPEPLPHADTQVIVTMAEARGLKVSYVDSNDEAVDPGNGARLKLSVPDVTEAADEAEADPPTSTPAEGEVTTPKKQPPTSTTTSSTSTTSAKKRKPKKAKPITVIRFEKQSTPKNGGPLCNGDVLTLDILQSRTTGAISAMNIVVVERAKRVSPKAPMVTAGTSNSGSGGGNLGSGGSQGVVLEVARKGKFGFIVPQRGGDKIFFHLSDVLQPSSDHTTTNSEEKKQNQRVLLSNDRASGSIQKNDEVSYDLSTSPKNGKPIAIRVQILPRGTLNLSSNSFSSKNVCRGLLLMEPSHTSLINTPQHTSSLSSRERSGSFGRDRSGSIGGGRDRTGSISGSSGLGRDRSGSMSRWEKVEDTNIGKPQKKASVIENGKVLLLSDPGNVFQSVDAVSVSKEPVASVKEEQGDADAAATEEGEVAEAKVNPTNPAPAPTITPEPTPFQPRTLSFGKSASSSEKHAPRRGDLVSFVKASASSSSDIKELRVVTKGVAQLVRGTLEAIDLKMGTAVFIRDGSGSVSGGTANGNGGNGGASGGSSGERFPIALTEVVSCNVKVLKHQEAVEVVMHQGKVYGVCRTTDLYLKSKVCGSKERTRLNLTVKRDLTGKIMAQSGMAKGPPYGNESDNGFETGWTKRISPYVREETPTAPAPTAPASILVKEAVEDSDASIEKSTLSPSSQVFDPAAAFTQVK